MSNYSKPTARRAVSAFALAKPATGVSAKIDVDDVLQVRPSWTHQQAAEFLRANATVIGDEMEISGTAVLVELLGEGSDVN